MSQPAIVNNKQTTANPRREARLYICLYICIWVSLCPFRPVHILTSSSLEPFVRAVRRPPPLCLSHSVNRHSLACLTLIIRPLSFKISSCRTLSHEIKLTPTFGSDPLKESRRRSDLPARARATPPARCDHKALSTGRACLASDQHTSCSCHHHLHCVIHPTTAPFSRRS